MAISITYHNIFRRVEAMESDGGETNIAGALELVRQQMFNNTANGKREGTRPPPNPDGVKELVIFVTDGVVSYVVHYKL